MIIEGRPYQIAQEHGLKFTYRYYDGDVNGAVSFWRNDSDEPTTFIIVGDSGQGEIWVQTLELLCGEWPI